MLRHEAIAGKPIGGHLCVGDFSAIATDKSARLLDTQQTLHFHLLCSDAEVLHMVSDEPSIASKAIRDMVTNTFGDKRFRIENIKLDASLTDPRDFPHRIHRIFTRSTPDDNDEPDADAEILGTADILYGYKAAKWGRSDMPKIEAPLDEEEEEEDERPKKRRRKQQEEDDDSDSEEDNDDAYQPAGADGEDQTSGSESESDSSAGDANGKNIARR